MLLVVRKYLALIITLAFCVANLLATGAAAQGDDRVPGDHGGSICIEIAADLLDVGGMHCDLPEDGACGPDSQAVMVSLIAALPSGGGEVRSPVHRMGDVVLAALRVDRPPRQALTTV